MSNFKIGDKVKLYGRIKEIIFSEKETLYKIDFFDDKTNPAPNFVFSDVIVRGKDLFLFE